MSKVYFNVTFFDMIFYEMVAKCNVLRFRVLHMIMTYSNDTLRINEKWHSFHVNCIITKLTMNPNNLRHARSINSILRFGSEIDTLVCFFDCQWTSFPSRKWHPLVVLSQSSWDPPNNFRTWMKNTVLVGYHKLREGSWCRYRKMFFTKDLYG